MNIVSLSSDFASGDFEIGALAGVIWRIAPFARLVHLTHDIERHNVRQAALMLDRCVPYFPEGSIHVVVVDPGVGTQRRPLAARLGRQFFVGPDNGILTCLYHNTRSAGKTIKIVHANRREYWLPEVSNIFHGRDVFAPLVGHLAAGVALEDLGEAIDNPVLLQWSAPEAIEGGWRGEVVDVDHFGNLATNIHKRHLQGMQVRQVQVAGWHVDGMVRTFGDRPAGELVALIDSSNELGICVVNGNAQQTTGAQVGDEVVVLTEPNGE